MPGYREGVFNVGDAESYVTGNDKLAAQQGDFLMRQKLMQQNAAALQAQLLDSQANRNLQRDLTGTAADRFGYESQLQKDRYGNDQALEAQRGTNSLNIVNTQMGPANARLDMERTAYADQQPERDLAGAKAKYDQGRLNAQGTVDSFKDNLVSQALRDASGGNAAPSAGMPGSPLAGPPDPSAQPHHAGLSPRMNERLLQSTLGLGEDPADVMFRDAVGARLKTASPEELPGLVGSLRSGDPNSIPTNTKGYLDLAGDPRVTDKLKSLTDVINNNNIYFTQDNMDELSQRYSEFEMLINSLHASPEAKAQLLDMVKGKIRETVQSRQTLFQGLGMGKIADKYGK